MLKILKIISFYLLLFPLLLMGSFTVAQTDPNNSAGTVKTVSEGSDNRIAPGEFLPVSVKLINFGSQKRVDVVVDYKILDSNGEEIISESETVAVETTASFIKRIQIHYTLKPGFYTLVTVLNYPYQEYPAISKFPFLVEEKIGGFFKSDLIFYAIFIVLIILAAIFITYLFTKRKRGYNIINYDYNDKPKNEIIYYEMLSDIITQMRLHIGDDALEIANNIEDLEINNKNGLIINIKKDPAKIVALLISRYEKLLGQPISFRVSKKI